MFLSVLGIALCLAKPASAQNFVLTIDVTNPSAVTIVTTGSFSSADSSATSTAEGVDLLNFFTAEISGSGFTNYSNLVPADTMVLFDRWYIDNASGSNVDLNLYNGNPGTPQTFTTTTPVFSGSASYNFSAFASQLPLSTSGATGNVIAGDSSGDKVVLGTWQIVPEPGACGLLLLAGLVLGVTVYRRRALQG
ncbi:hypothetical protein BH09VER1_BH09VER1_36070 [soil metagenome]